MNEIQVSNFRSLSLRTLQIGLLLSSILPAQPAALDVTVTKNVMVTMRDGVKLATDLYRPSRNGVAAPGKFPVLMSRTPAT